MKPITALLTVSLLSNSISGGAAMAQLTSSAHSTASSFNGSVSYSGQLTGHGIARYGLNTLPGQPLTITLHTNNLNTRMQVLRDGDSSPLCESSASQSFCHFQAEPNANYLIQVFLLRDAAQRGEQSQFSLSIEQAH